MVAYFHFSSFIVEETRVFDDETPLEYQNEGFENGTRSRGAKR